MIRLCASLAQKSRISRMNHMTKTMSGSGGLDTIDHVAISVDNIVEAVEWYRNAFKCEIVYQDDSWAMLRFANMKLALVVPNQHPPHIGLFSRHAEQFGELKPHRDGTRSTYITDPSGNWVEVLAMDDRAS